jgi:hypothetical protein
MLSQIIRAFFLMFSNPVRLLTAMVLAVLTIGTPATAQTPAVPSSAPPPPVSLSALIDQTLAAFPRVEADVVDIQGTTLTLSVGARSGAQTGLALQVFREGKEIRHPRSGQLLGRTEQSLGRAVVVSVFDGYSLARHEGGEQPRVGDRARTAAGKIKLMLIPLSGTAVRDNLAEAVSNEIYEGLTRTGRFQVVLGDPVVAWLLQQRITPEEFLRGNGVAAAFERFKPDNILALQFSRIEKRPYLEVRLFSDGRQTPAFSTALFVPPSIKVVQPGRFSGSDRFGAPTPEVKKRSLLARLLGGELDKGTYSSGENSIPLKEVARFGFVIAGLDVAVAPADQIPRLVVTDGERVSVYRVVDRALEPDWSFHERSAGRIFSVQFLDAGDGVLSVVANRFDIRFGMSSFIVTARAGKPVVLVNSVDAILLAVDEKGRGIKQTLWSQSFSRETFFARGQVDQMVLRNGTLARERGVAVPETFRATGAALSNILSKDAAALVFIDDQNRLRIANATEETWRSSSSVGGGLPRLEIERQIERGGRSYFHQVEPTPLSVDLDGDGVPEVIVPQNQLQGGFLGVIYRGPAGLRFQQVASGFEGVIAGLGAIPQEDGAAPILIAAVVQYQTLLKRSGETRIIMTTPE